MSLPLEGEDAAAGAAAHASITDVMEAYGLNQILNRLTGNLSQHQYPGAIMAEMREIHNDLHAIPDALEPLRRLDKAVGDWLLALPPDFGDSGTITAAAK
eukprot:3935756-Rhodomonas_salina.1